MYFQSLIMRRIQMKRRNRCRWRMIYKSRVLRKCQLKTKGSFTRGWFSRTTRKGQMTIKYCYMIRYGIYRWAINGYYLRVVIMCNCQVLMGIRCFGKWWMIMLLRIQTGMVRQDYRCLVLIVLMYMGWGEGVQRRID